VSSPSVRQIHVVRAAPEDAPRLSELLAASWRDNFAAFLPPTTLKEVSGRWHGREHLAAQILDPKIFFAAAKTPEGRIVGLATLRLEEPGSAFLHRLYVENSSQGLGIGENLLKTAMAAFPGLKTVKLEVLTENIRAISFYERQGFRKAGAKTTPLKNGVLELTVMEKNT